MNIAETTTNNETYDLFNEADEAALKNNYGNKLTIKSKNEAENFLNIFCLALPDITVKQLKSSSRIGYIAQCRHLAIYIIKKHSTLTLGEIGKIFGYRDHSTVRNSYLIVENEFDFKERHKEIRSSEDYKFYKMWYDHVTRNY